MSGQDPQVQCNGSQCLFCTQQINKYLDIWPRINCSRHLIVPCLRAARQPPSCWQDELSCISAGPVPRRGSWWPVTSDLQSAENVPVLWLAAGGLIRHWPVELKELSFFLIFIILHALFNAPMCVDSENLCMGSPALLKKVRTPSKK